MRVLSIFMACLMTVSAFARPDRDRETLDLFHRYLQNQEKAETLVMRTFTHLRSFEDDIDTIADETQRLVHQGYLTKDEEKKVYLLQTLYNQTVWEHNRLAKHVFKHNLGLLTVLNLMFVPPLTLATQKFAKLSRPMTILFGALSTLIAAAAGPASGVVYDFLVNERYVKPVTFADNMNALPVR